MPRIARKSDATITFHFAGEPVEAQAGDSVVAALLAAGQKIFRTTPVSGAGRGPLCLMGVCFDCLVQIDGQGNQQACMREARNGMVVERQDGALDPVAATPAEETP